MTEEKKGICESVVEFAMTTVVVEAPAETTVKALYRLAEKIDAQAAHAAANARWLAVRLERFAADAEIGVVVETTPLRSSAADEIEASAAKYVAMKEAFDDLFALVVGRTFPVVRRDWRAS